MPLVLQRIAPSIQPIALKRVVWVLATLAAAPSARCEERIWTDQSGKFQLSAELVDVQEGKARLKRPDGRIVAVPVERLCEADREHLERSAAEQGAAGATPWKVGDKAYLQTRGQWQLAVVTRVHDGPGSARYEVMLRTGARRSMRVTEKRLRRYGKAGDKGLLLPGDVVEILDTWGKEVVNTGVVVRVAGSRAYVKPEGELAEKSYWLKSLRAPGAADDSSLAGRVASAADRSRKPSKKTHPADKLVYPDDPELTAVNADLAPLLDLDGGGPDGGGRAPSRVRLDVAGTRPSIDHLRPLPVSLIPKQHSFDKAVFSVAAGLDLAAVLRTTWSPKRYQLELVPLRKTRAENRFLGMPPGTEAVELSPDAAWLMSRRDDPPRIDLWKVLWGAADRPGDERKRVEGLEHHVSWAPGDPSDSWFDVKRAGWTDAQTVLTIDSKHQAIQWRASTAEPLRRLDLGANHALLAGTPYVVINRGPRGASIVNLRSAQVEAVIGSGEGGAGPGVLPGKPSLSPSGRWLLLVGRGNEMEFWDLHTGKRELQTRLVSTDKNAPLHLHGAAWSQEEAYLAAGGGLIDVRTWRRQPRPSGAAARSRAGLVWSLGAGRKNEPVLTAARTAEPLADDAVGPNAEGPFLLQRGDEIAVDVSPLNRSIADASRRRIEEMVREQGYRVAGASPFVIRAEVKTSTETKEYGRGMFPRSGQKGNFNVSFQVRDYALSLRHEGVELVSAFNRETAQPLGRYKTEAELRADARRPLGWDAASFARIRLPETVIAVEPAGG